MDSNTGTHAMRINRKGIRATIKFCFASIEGQTSTCICCKKTSTEIQYVAIKHIIPAEPQPVETMVHLQSRFLCLLQSGQAICKNCRRAQLNAICKQITYFDPAWADFVFSPDQVPFKAQ